MKLDATLTIPKGLTRAGRKAAQAILAVLVADGSTETGGCRTFYSPREWKKRGELYGKDSLLIVVYDGGAVRDYFHSYDYKARMERMDAALAAAGFRHERCTGVYTSVYAND